MSEMSDKFNSHRERRISEISQRKKESRLRYKRKYKTWIVGFKDIILKSVRFDLFNVFLFQFILIYWF